MPKKKYTFIDLFAGCGGLSEGFYRVGFKALAHVEINHWACETLRTRMRYYGYSNIDKSVIEHDITADDIIDRIEQSTSGTSPDIIIISPNYHRIIHKNNPRFNRRKFQFEFENGEVLRLKLYEHLKVR